MVKLTKANLAILQAASTDFTRHDLNGIGYEDSGVLVATDGFIQSAFLPDGSVPERPIKPSPVLPIAKAKEIRSLLKRDTSAEFLPEHGTIITQDGCIHDAPSLPDAEFPNWRNTLAHTDREAPTLMIDARLLKRACDIAIANHSGKPGESVNLRVTIGREEDPIRLESDAEGCARILTIVATMRM